MPWSIADSTFLREGSVSQEEATECALSIARGPVTPLAVVEAMGGALNHDDVARRRAAVDFLGRVLEALPRGALNGEECRFVAKFLIDRLQDRAVMHSPVLRGLRGLTVGQGSILDDDDLVHIVWTLLGGVHVQSFTVDDRRRVYDVLLCVIRDRLERFLSPVEVAERFLLGFVQVVEGETNAGNLLLLFSAWPVLLRRLPLSDTLAEEAFEALACYYPVDYSGAQDGVTRKELAAALRSCLLATNKFGRLSLDIFLEKLSSDIVSSKAEALLCLRDGVHKLPLRFYVQKMSDIWGHCKQEIMGIRASSSNRLIKLSHELLANMTKALQASPSVKDRWLSLIWSELKPFLGFLESKLMTTAVDILSTVLANLGADSPTDLLRKILEMLLDVRARTESDKILVTKAILQASRAAPQLVSPDLCQMLLRVAEESLQQESSDVQMTAVWMDILVTLSSTNKGMITPALRNYLIIFLLDNDENLINVKKAVIDKLSASEDNRDVIELWFQRLQKEQCWRDDDVSCVACVCKNSEHMRLVIITTLVESLTTKMDDQRLAAIEKIWDSLDGMDSRAKSLFAKETFLASLLSRGRAQSLLRKISCISSTILDETFLTGNVLKVLSSPDKADPTTLANSTTILCSLPVHVLRSIDLSIITVGQGSVARMSGKCLASLVNKLGPKDVRIAKAYEEATAIEKHRSWLLKGLLMAGHRAGDEMEKLFLSLEKNRQDSVEKILNVVRDDVDLAASGHHLVLPFYKQRFFQASVKSLRNLFESTRDPVFLEAIVGQLPLVPKSVSRPLLLPLLPLLTENLSSTAILSDFLDFVHHLDSTVALQGWERLVPFLIKVAEEKKTIPDRTSALHALERAAHNEDLVKKRELVIMVVKGTSPLLNDKKRLVRKAAADARNAWLVA